MKKALLIYIVLVSLWTFLLSNLIGCTTLTRLSECRLLCQGEKVERFKDETSECLCKGCPEEVKQK